ncbi:MAG: Radical domain protein [Gammaproteobacteria bacterium]|nr:Radical domain protein [Gammaproteobacteria bacterium]
MGLGSIERLLPDFARLGTQVVLLSGGEPLLNREWQPIARSLRSAGLRVWLLTSGLSLAKHARHAAALFDDITVSVDGIDRGTYAAIRGLDAFDRVCEGVRAAADWGRPPSLRVTLQRTNYRHLSEFVDLAKAIGARQISFLAVDVANPHAFGRTGASQLALALGAEDLTEFDQCLERLERSHAAEFRSGFIAESPAKLRRIHQYFAAVRGAGGYPAVRCNAPEFSAVVTAEGNLQPCFFIAGSDAPIGSALTGALNSDSMMTLRADIGAGKRAECKTCVCSMWRDPRSVSGTSL